MQLELTHEQQVLVDHAGGHARLLGASGTGKTTALVARYLALVRRQRPSQVLVLCRHRAAADRFRDAVLPGLAGGFDVLPITSVFGLAYDLVTRHGGPIELVSRAQQRSVVAELLRIEDAGHWPTAGQRLRRDAFVDEVLGAVVAVQSSLLESDEIVRRAEAAGAGDRWGELVAFLTRYCHHLGRRGQLDAAGLVARACHLLDTSVVRREESGRFAVVLVDDYDAARAPADELLRRLAGLGAEVTVAGDPTISVDGAGSPLQTFPDHFNPSPDVTLTRPFRNPETLGLVCCNHPAVEPEAVAGELLHARAAGVPWADMAVLVPRGNERGRSIARALSRHGVPVVPLLPVVLDQPVVRAVVDMLRWVAGDETVLPRLLASPLAGIDASDLRSLLQQARAGTPPETDPRLGPLVELRDHLRSRAGSDSPGELAFQIWQARLNHLAHEPSPADERAIDALVAFVDGLRSQDERNPADRLSDVVALLDTPDVEPDAWRLSASGNPDAVTVTSIAGAAGREWDTVVVAGCVEGELPRLRSRAPVFDPAVVAGRPVPSPAERRQLVLAEERSRFGIACSRATGRLVAVAAPEPGVLVSRFVEGWVPRAARLPLAPGRSPAARPLTAGAVPVFPEGQLRLSASQLDTYDDCPLRYAFEYVLRVRDETTVYAELGSLVHKVLAEFLDPEGPERPRDRKALMALAQDRWRDDIARYRPQVEEARRHYFDMLDQWWEAEGGDTALPPEVLAVEKRFEVDVGPHRLTGAIDRIDRADDGVGIRIVDYKTGKREPPRGSMPDNLQLSVYHLGAERQPELAALGPPTQLRLLFLRTMHVFEQPILPDHSQITEDRVLATADRMLAEDFEPSPHANCRVCSFWKLCPLQPDGRQCRGES